QESARWRVQSKLAGMRMVRNDLQGGAGKVMGGAVAIAYAPITLYKSIGVVSYMMNASTPGQAFLTSGTSGSVLSTASYEFGAYYNNKETTKLGYATAIGIGFFTGGVQGWATGMSGQYTYLSLENLVWHTTIIPLAMPLEYINSVHNTKEKD
ncbi:MAG: hypothetical protein VW882_05740, partial [Gammaproteobacteria bacterium]